MPRLTRSRRSRRHRVFRHKHAVELRLFWRRHTLFRDLLHPPNRVRRPSHSLGIRRQCLTARIESHLYRRKLFHLRHMLDPLRPIRRTRDNRLFLSFDPRFKLCRRFRLRLCELFVFRCHGSFLQLFRFLRRGGFRFNRRLRSHSRVRRHRRLRRRTRLHHSYFGNLKVLRLFYRRVKPDFRSFLDIKLFDLSRLNLIRLSPNGPLNVQRLVLFHRRLRKQHSARLLRRRSLLCCLDPLQFSDRLCRYFRCESFLLLGLDRRHLHLRLRLHLHLGPYRSSRLRSHFAPYRVHLRVRRPRHNHWLVQIFAARRPQIRPRRDPLAQLLMGNFVQIHEPHTGQMPRIPRPRHPRFRFDVPHALRQIKRHRHHVIQIARHQARNRQPAFAQIQQQPALRIVHRHEQGRTWH